MRVVICGAGAIGACIAYFLGERGVGTTVIDSVAVAAAASGNAGGFLARDWCDGSALAPLARKSFALHAELARRAAVDWGYRRLDTLLVEGAAGHSKPSPGTPAWLDGACRVRGAIGDPQSTAQVHPARFTRAMMDAARALGASFVRGRVGGVLLSGDGRSVSGVRVDGDELRADAVVVAMGPWSVLLAEQLPIPPIYGLKGHSITLVPRTPVTAHALFVELGDEAGSTPEVFPRPDGEVYLCGLSDDSPVPVDPASVAPTTSDAGERLHAIAARLSTALAAAAVTGAKACFRPIASDALPVMGRLGDVGGAFIASGHNCWGILNAPATGLAMAELIHTGRCEALDLAAFDPARFQARASLRMA